MRNIIILGSAPGSEKCPLDREAWVVGKYVMGEHPLSRADKFFMLDNIDDLLSTKVVSNETSYRDEENRLKKRCYNLFKADSLKLGPSQFFTSTIEIKKSIDKFISLRQSLVHQNRFTKEDFIAKVNSYPNVPFITVAKHPDIPTSEAYPLKEIVEKYKIPYFTNTICYMLAYALYEKVDSVQLWGVRQGGYYEYIRERKGVEFWLGVLAGQGIKIEVKGESDLFKNDDNLLYGYKKSPEQLKYEGII